MTPLQIALTLIGMAVITYGLRVVPMVATNPGERAQRLLKYVPVAVLSAISLPIMLSPADTLHIALSNPFLIGGIAAIITAALSKRIMPTIIVGMMIFLLVQAIF